MECGLIRETLAALCNHLEDQFRTRRSRDRDLASGYLYVQMEKLMRTSRSQIGRVLRAFLDAAEIEAREYARFRLDTEHTIARALLFREMERNEKASLDDALARAFSLAKRRALVEKLSEKEAWDELSALCDWIEASLARSAFVVSRTDRKIFSTRDLEARSHALVLWLHYNKNLTPSGKSQRLREELDEIGERFREPYPDGLIAVSEAHQHAQLHAPAAPATTFEQRLFDLWPLVKHGEWSKAELCKLIRDAKVGFLEDEIGAFEEDANTFCRNRGLRGGSSLGKSGRGRGRESPPHAQLARMLLREAGSVKVRLGRPK